MNKIKNYRYRQKYHIMPPKGWMNDPNGLCFFKGYYHVFFQYHPYSSEWGPMHWGHVRSMDLIHWEECPIALTPGDDEDKDGCFSGSAVVKDGKLYLIYTGHHYKKNMNKEQYWQNQNIAFSEDGIHFKKYKNNPVISSPPIDNTADFRDPKIWFEKDKWFIVLGSQNQAGLGRALLYSSDSLFHWTYIGVLSQSNRPEEEGYMWECPDFFQLDGHRILLTSPQGIIANNEMFKNVYQTGYFIGDNQDGLYTRGNFNELDSGHDFYATQTFKTDDGRRILLAWMDMWNNKMPEQSDGWAGTLTIPRELRLFSNKLYSFPIQEMKTLRSGVLLTKNDFINRIEFSSIEHQLEIDAKIIWNKTSDISLDMKDCKGFKIISVFFDAKDGKVMLHRDGPDADRQAIIDVTNNLSIRIYVDTSSFELFINNGEATFSERFYSERDLHFNLMSQQNVWCDISIYKLENSYTKYHL